MREDAIYPAEDKQEPMPLSKMVVDSPATPIDLPFHPAAAEFWQKMGYLK